MMETFRHMVNDCIRIGLEYDTSTLKKLSNMAYQQLGKYQVITYYKLNAISKAAGILTNRNKSIKRGLKPRQPYATRPLLVSCYGFKVAGGILKVPLGNRKYFDIPLNHYVKRILSDSSLRIHSFTLTAEAVSICYSKEVMQVKCTGIEGVDRTPVRTLK